MTVIIYTLSAPDEPQHIRYVGCTIKSMTDRLKRHLWDAQRSISPRALWIRKLLRLGQVPIITVVFTQDMASKEAIEQLEKKFIWQYALEGHELLNSTRGGGLNFLGHHHTNRVMPLLRKPIRKKTDAEKIAISSMMRKKWRDPAYLKSQRLAIRQGQKRKMGML